MSGIAIGNYMNVRIGNGNLNNGLYTQRHKDATKTNAGSVFGPQCKVTISSEGRKLSEQLAVSEPKRFTAASGMERLLLRQQKQDEMSRSEQSDTLSEISGLMSSIKNSYAAGEDKETIENKQEALNRLLNLKAQQEEENERRVKDAASSAAGASKEQEEIDRKNSDLYLLLKTLEEKEEDEENGSGAKSDAVDTGSENGQGSFGDEFRQSASMLGASAARRELEAKGVIDDMFNSGYGRLAEADAMMHEIQAELDLAAEALGRANLSEAEKDQLMSEHVGRATDMMLSNYGAMTDLRRKGYQEIQDAKELELRHIAVDPLDGVDKAKQTILDAGAAAALHEVSQGALDEASRELEERVQEEIDKRNDVVSGSGEDEAQERTEETLEEKEAEKLEEKELEQEEREKIQINSKFMN